MTREQRMSLLFNVNSKCASIVPANQNADIRYQGTTTGCASIIQALFQLNSALRPLYSFRTNFTRNWFVIKGTALRTGKCLSTQWFEFDDVVI